MQLLKINEINSLNIFPLNNLTKSQKFYFFDSTAQALKFYAEETTTSRYVKNLRFDMEAN